ncbi:BrnA antitoxin of type II toxin-antitoxin system [Rhizobium sp. RU20A]|uniref:BrnA antitoxin family protein n=1 Tax=Rhizobium sp. RU20A TaxID=1907412 RepID=UPI00095718BB|nr:BrnA antitoxin family protein [Rhizobium sp. RU20A]SIR15778.1 BrnA antitoxin of type II toxin-antitoxin system [Rhizobium sp. RU20A]
MSSAPDTGRFVLVDGKPHRREADGRLVPTAGRTDFRQLDAMSEQAVEDGAISDPDALAMSDDEWATAVAVKPAKVPMTLKLDADVLDWFRQNGKGYQTRINMVLRRYMEAQKKAG